MESFYERSFRRRQKAYKEAVKRNLIRASNCLGGRRSDTWGVRRPGASAWDLLILRQIKKPAAGTVGNVNNITNKFTR